MPFVEEVFENKGGLFGAHTGRKYEAGETEMIGPERWSKPWMVQPGVINVEVEYPDIAEAVPPHEKIEKD